ncbi:hypothetical protein PR048_025330 [Dryococelus australis]|uniref:Uncharacterized protein n=1 Tax=Dryococelus australis TaxID=614101 RepID=A0ABQ9GQZ7_9NEOP|nr:hypothetical protein PR048_025330 [Dryococelus australis]
MVCALVQLQPQVIQLQAHIERIVLLLQKQVIQPGVQQTDANSGGVTSETVGHIDRIQEKNGTGKKEYRKNETWDYNTQVAQLFTDYWTLGSFNKRIAFLSGLISYEGKKATRKRKQGSNKEKTVTHKYHINVREKRHEVCKGCFKKMFAETNRDLSLAQQVQTKGAKVSQKINSRKL